MGREHPLGNGTSPNRIAAALSLNWIGRRRIKAYSLILLFVSALSYFYSYSEATGDIGSDFLAFWSAAKLALAGAAGTVYDLSATGAVQATVGRENVFAFVNPPPMLLFSAPLGAFPYPLAWGLWIAVTFALWLFATRWVAPRLGWSLAAFPGALVSGWHAQTGLLTGALLAGAARLLGTRPFLAGLCIGALVIKPHLAILAPFALLAARQWRAIAGAAVGSIGLIALSALVFGPELLLAYPKSWAVSQYLMATGDADFFLRQVTVYAALRVAATPMIATAVQSLVTLGCIALTWKVWSGRGSIEGKFALLFALTPLATPYLFSYDLAFLALPVFWLIMQAGGVGAGLWERPRLLLFYFSPLLCRALALPLGINLTLFVQAWMVWEVLRHLREQAAPLRPA